MIAITFKGELTDDIVDDLFALRPDAEVSSRDGVTTVELSDGSQDDVSKILRFLPRHPSLPRLRPSGGKPVYPTTQGFWSRLLGCL